MDRHEAFEAWWANRFGKALPGFPYGLASIKVWCEQSWQAARAAEREELEVMMATLKTIGFERKVEGQQDIDNGARWCNVLAEKLLVEKAVGRETALEEAAKRCERLLAAKNTSSEDNLLIRAAAAIRALKAPAAKGPKS